MSLSDYLKERAVALGILRRLDAGDASAMEEVRPLLKKIDDRERVHQEEESQRVAKKERRQKSGRLNSGAFEVAPRVERGVDFGAKGLVLARKGTVRLVWRYAHTAYLNRLNGSVAASPSLEVLTEGGSLPKDITDSYRNTRRGGWRLSRNLIMEYASQIDSFFGAGVAAQVSELKGTVVVEDNPAQATSQERTL